MSSATAPTKAPSASKYDAQILAQLERAQRRIRLLDLTTSALVLVAASLAYLSAVTMLDSWQRQPEWVLRLAFGLYVVAAGAYAVFYIIRPLRWRINPYYA